MERSKAYELLKNANELAQIGMEAGRLCIADFMEFLSRKVDDALDCWGDDE